MDLGGVILGQKKSDGLYEMEDAPPPGGDATGGAGSPSQSGATDTGKDGGPSPDDSGNDAAEGGESKGE